MANGHEPIITVDQATSMYAIPAAGQTTNIYFAAVCTSPQADGQPFPMNGGTNISFQYWLSSVPTASGSTPAGAPAAALKTSAPGLQTTAVATAVAVPYPAVSAVTSGFTATPSTLIVADSTGTAAALANAPQLNGTNPSQTSLTITSATTAGYYMITGKCFYTNGQGQVINTPLAPCVIYVHA